MKKFAIWLWMALCCLPLDSHAFEIMLPQVYSDRIDVSNWLVSEKLDGVRGYWDGKRLFSKNGNPFHPPSAFTRNFPPFELEGEIWGGRQTFEKTVSIVKKKQPHDGWMELQFAIFDVPRAAGGFTRRLQKAKDWFDNHPTPFAFVISQKPIMDKEQLNSELQRIERLGGEGLIVRKPDALYRKGRNREILKVKSYDDMEALVVAHIPGKGRNLGRLGSLLVELPGKIRFKIGSGFSDEERINPPAVGTIITFKYYGFFKSGRPRFPSYLRIRQDASL
jgi:DNA ligase-1